MHPEKRYPRTGDRETVYLKQVITNPNIRVGDFTMYHDFIHDPRQFEQNAVRYHYPLNHDKLIIGKFCSIACGVQFLFNSANHTKKSLSTYPFPLFFEEWGLDIRDVASAWDNKGDIVIGNDVWIGREVLFTPGRTVKDGTVTVTREAHPGADVLNREQAQELLLSPLASKGSKVPSEIWKNIPSDWFPLPLYCATADEF